MPERSVSIADARARLPRLVRDAEGGATVEITRRGKAVAMLVSTTTYERLMSQRAPFGEALDDFLSRVEIDRIGLEPGEFEALRDRSSGREPPW